MTKDEKLTFDNNKCCLYFIKKEYIAGTISYKQQYLLLKLLLLTIN